MDSLMKIQIIESFIVLTNRRFFMKNKAILITIIGAAFLIIVGIFFILSQLNQPFINNNNFNVKESQKLPIPALLEDKNPSDDVSDFYLTVQQGETNFFNDVSTPKLGYNTNFLGPVIKVKAGQEVNMFIDNELQSSTSVHWHGLEVDGTKDGGPHQKIASGSSWN